MLTRSQKFWLLILDFILFVACLGVVSHYAEGFSFEKILMAAHMWLITWVVLVLYYVFGLYELPRSSSVLKFLHVYSEIIPSLKVISRSMNFRSFK